jgi:type VI secretion system protein ImpK
MVASHAPSEAPEPLPAIGGDLLGAGLNPLVRAASPLLLLAGRLRGTLSVGDVGSVRQHALTEIRAFEQRAQAASIPNEVVTAARYALCATLDEAVLSTPWGAQSEWSQNTLLVALHREAWGGEKFFDMLERTSKDPERYIDLMELQYLCLAVGFRGKYHVIERGHNQLADVQRDLYRRIREQRGTPQAGLSLRWEGLKDRRNPVIRYVPWWVVGAAALVVLAVAFTYFRVTLANEARRLNQQLTAIADETRAAVPRGAPCQGLSVKQTLAQERLDQSLSVEDVGGKTVVTIPGASLFDSGKVAVRAEHVPLLEQIARALAGARGEIQVVGHTDSQRLRTLFYADNYALSTARAESVKAILEKNQKVRGRVSTNGAGDSRPAVPPASDPANWPRNRRVEIIFTPGACR